MIFYLLQKQKSAKLIQFRREGVISSFARKRDNELFVVRDFVPGEENSWCLFRAYTEAEKDVVGKEIMLFIFENEFEYAL
mmetsp:Transcript_7150/g.10687  ORF Transcript_7150/g.10687 Transcript_7150/m.10687 type:complete len:80 (+) Transcript_7150:450-689(+)